MQLNISTLSKKTKAEILHEYEKLLASVDVAKSISEEAHAPAHMQAVLSAQNEFNASGVTSATRELKTTIAEKLNEMSKELSNTLDALAKQTLEEVEKLSALTNAIDLGEKRLKSQYHVEIVASTLHTLIAEYDEKKKQLEQEHALQQSTLTELLTARKREWQREEEEYTYTQKTSRAREQSLYEENRKKKEVELGEREKILQATEEELASLRTQVECMPAEGELRMREIEQDVIKRCNAEHKTATEQMYAAWDTEKKILELKYTHLETQYKKLESELLYAKKEAEGALKKAQELAVTVIEHRGGQLLNRTGEEKS